MGKEEQSISKMPSHISWTGLALSLFGIFVIAGGLLYYENLSIYSIVLVMSGFMLLGMGSIVYNIQLQSKIQTEIMYQLRALRKIFEED